MARQSRQQWQSLIAEFEVSGQTQTEFCKQRNLNPKYFSLKRSKLIVKDVTDVPAFTEVKLEQPRVSYFAIELEFGKVTIKISNSTPVAYLADVIRALV
ncbi:IS66 family insertion sequence element accessory protein TnpA [Halioxenophilus sp. WMMB6]|uniref:IS66 family insertion sequence element accessory protein TnpA n=1 Tax=Halioxenophilus sp. WMMB6 TaxID=3073815 RepID=UPI00295E6CC5|nr:hypothetical protein [Halioxenophilus sp. WMMB6]